MLPATPSRKRALLFDHHLAKVPMAEIGVSTVTEAELRYGLARRPSPALQATIDTFLLAVTVFPWNSEAAHHYGELRAGLERLGQLLGSMDMMIAAHALSLGLTLISSDVAFKRIKQLKVEDWTK